MDAPSSPQKPPFLPIPNSPSSPNSPRSTPHPRTTPHLQLPIYNSPFPLNMLRSYSPLPSLETSVSQANPDFDNGQVAGEYDYHRLYQEIHNTLPSPQINSREDADAWVRSMGALWVSV